METLKKMKTPRKTTYVAQYPTPEIAARENAHVSQMIMREAGVRQLLSENDEWLLRDVYEDSQLRLEIEDEIVGIEYKLRRELEGDFREELEDKVREIRKELEADFREKLARAQAG
jgi:hypothetical protein